MASFSAPTPKTSALLAPHPNPKQNLKPPRTATSLAFHSDLKSTRGLIAGSSFGFQASKGNKNDVMRVSAQLNEVALQEPSNSVPAHEEKPEESTKTGTTIPDVDSINAFMNQVQNLVELVDSRDIMELQLKQQDCEILIRKKAAIPQPPAPQMVMMPSPQAQPMYQPQPPPQSAPQPAPQPADPASGSAPSASPPALPAPAQGGRPLKSPMPGMFYRSPSPGADPFVSEGQQVKKGQVLCIIEAMKLMNEFTADRDGTIVSILIPDATPIDVDQPLFIMA